MDFDRPLLVTLRYGWRWLDCKMGAAAGSAGIACSEAVLCNALLTINALEAVPDVAMFLQRTWNQKQEGCCCGRGIDLHCVFLHCTAAIAIADMSAKR